MSDGERNAQKIREPGELDLRVKFAARNDTLEDNLKTNTPGLVTLDDFKAKREQLERHVAVYSSKYAAHKRPREVQEKRHRIRTATLSFAHDAIENSDTSSDDNETRRRNNRSALGMHRLGKDPAVATDFLPDIEREAAEKLERKRLESEWKQEQDRMKREYINVVYSFWDGSGHRRVKRCTKGTTIGRFLVMVQSDFPQLRSASADALLFVKEDLIIPHHYSFYDFIVSNARGKSGPLFDFSVQEDVRLLADASKEKQDVHAAKIVERRWFERNKHIFPASRWTIYDPLVEYGKYTIH